MISQGEGCREDVGGMAAHTTNVRKITNLKAYTTWAHILSDRNVFAPRGEGENGGVQCPRGFSCFFLGGGHLLQTSPRSKQYLPVIFVRLAFIRQNFRKRWCRKLLAIEWHKSPFDESKNEGASKL